MAQWWEDGCFVWYFANAFKVVFREKSKSFPHFQINYYFCLKLFECSSSMPGFEISFLEMICENLMTGFSGQRVWGSAVSEDLGQNTVLMQENIV